MKIGLFIFATLTATSALGAPIPNTYGPYPEQTFVTMGSPTSKNVVAIMHGGWDRAGNNTDADPVSLGTALVKRGAFVVLFNYRLAISPTQGWPAQWQDAQTVVRYLKTQFPKARIGIVGLSAGGYNALGATFYSSTIMQPRTDPKNEAALYPTVTSTPDYVVAASPFSNLNGVLSDQVAVDAITVSAGVPSAGLDQATIRSIASPIMHVRADSPPTLIFHGKGDGVVPYSQSLALDREMTFIGAKHRFITTAGGHVFSGLTATALNTEIKQIGDCVVASPGTICR